jgi:hypothetical protein
MIFLLLTSAICSLLPHALASEVVVSSSDYTIWCTGACDTDVRTVTQPGAALQGGVDVEEAFAWQIMNANGGDFLVLEASYDDYYVVHTTSCFLMQIAFAHLLNLRTTCSICPSVSGIR